MMLVRRIQGALRRLANWESDRDIAKLVADVQKPDFMALRAQHVAPDFDSTQTEAFIKYFDVARFVRVNVERARRLGLDKCRGRRILDVGCGFGYFMRVCDYYGHSVV